MKESGPFFLGGAPGLIPTKPMSSISSSSNFPMKGLVIHEEDGEMEEEEDTRSLLDRMKETEERGFVNNHTTCCGAFPSSITLTGNTKPTTFSFPTRIARSGGYHRG